MLSFWSLKGGWMPTDLGVSSFQRQVRAPADLTPRKRYVSGGLKVLVSSRGGCTRIPETAFPTFPSPLGVGRGWGEGAELQSPFLQNFGPLLW